MEFLSTMWHSTWQDASISCDRAPVASPNPWQETSTNWYSHYYLHEMISWWSINTKSFTQTIEQIDTKDQDKEIYTDYWADGYKRPEQWALNRLLGRRIQKNPARRALHGLLSRWYQKSAQRALHRLLSRWIQKTRTKSFTQTIEQMDPKNQNKELYTDSWQMDSKNQNKELYADYWADGYKTTRRKMSGNRHARGVRGEQRSGER